MECVPLLLVLLDPPLLEVHCALPGLQPAANLGKVTFYRLQLEQAIKHLSHE
jgi:hypothetical protein